jgi:hypothetical protein
VIRFIHRVWARFGPPLDQTPHDYRCATRCRKPERTCALHPFHVCTCAAWEQADAQRMVEAFLAYAQAKG